MSTRASILALACVLLCLSCNATKGGKAISSSAPLGSAQASASPLAASYGKIVIATSEDESSEPVIHAAEALTLKYGSVESGGRIANFRFPKKLLSDQSLWIDKFAEYANDPGIIAIIANKAIAGTAEAFERIKDKRPDILLIACNPEEAALTIELAADVVIDQDFLTGAWVYAKSAKRLGANSLVLLWTKRQSSNKNLQRARAIMSKACSDANMFFATEQVPDPEEAGIVAAQKAFDLSLPSMLRRYGKNAAYYCAVDAYQSLLYKASSAGNGIIPSIDLPVVLKAYPEAADPSAFPTNFSASLKALEEAVLAKGGAGKFGVLEYPFDYALTLAMADFVIAVNSGRANINRTEDLRASLNRQTRGVSWSVSRFIDQASGVAARSHYLVFEDSYIFGLGFLGTVSLADKMPPEYMSLASLKDQ